MESPGKNGDWSSFLTPSFLFSEQSKGLSSGINKFKKTSSNLQTNTHSQPRLMQINKIFTYPEYTRQLQNTEESLLYVKINFLIPNSFSLFLSLLWDFFCQDRSIQLNMNPFPISGFTVTSRSSVSSLLSLKSVFSLTQIT